MIEEFLCPLSVSQVIQGWNTAWVQLRMEDERASEYVFEVEDGILWASSPVPSDAIYWDNDCESWMNK